MKYFVSFGFFVFIASIGLGQKPKHSLGAILVSPGYSQGLIAYTQSAMIQGNAYQAVFSVAAPPPKDQLNEGSCVAWSVGYTFFSSYLHRNRTAVWNESTEMSPGFVYHFIKLNNNCGSGSNVPWVLQLISNIGACTWNSWPYVDNDCNTLPTDAQLREASKYRSPCGDPNSTDDPPVEKAGRAQHCDIGNAPLWVTIPPNSVEDYKDFLQHYKWPLIVAFNVDASFDQMWDTNGIWTVKSGVVRGGHSVCVIGWDDNKTFNGKTGMFKCQNQWGADGGDHGYFWVTYDLISGGCFNEAYGWVRDEHGQSPPPVLPNNGNRTIPHPSNSGGRN